MKTIYETILDHNPSLKERLDDILENSEKKEIFQYIVLLQPNPPLTQCNYGYWMCYLSTPSGQKPYTFMEAMSIALQLEHAGASTQGLKSALTILFPI